MTGAPHLLRLSRAVDIGLTVGGGKADGDILQRAAKAAHRMALKMGQHQQRIVLLHVAAHKVFVNTPAAVDRQLKIAFLVQNIHRGNLRPAVELHGFPVGFGGVALAFIGGIALHNGAVYLVHHGLHEIGADKVLVPHLAGMHLHRHLAGQLCPQRIIQADHRFGCDLLRKINLCHTDSSFPFVPALRRFFCHYYTA